MPSDLQFARGFAPYFERTISWFWVIWWENDSRFAVAAVQLKNISQAYWFFSQFVSLRRRELKCTNYEHGLAPAGFVSLRRRELKFSPYLNQKGELRSSPYGDVSWNKRVIRKKVHIEVRLLTETWVEIEQISDHSSSGRFVSLRRRELKSLASKEDYWRYKAFVSLRRRELKSTKRVHQTWLRGVRLLTETWVEIFWSNSSPKFLVRWSA